MVTTPERGDINWDVSLNAALDDLQSQITTNGSSITSVSSRVTTLENQNEFRASDHSFLTWNYDVTIAAQTSILTSGTVYMSKVNVRAAITATNLNYIVSTAGSSLTSGQNFVGLYDGSGTRLAVSADLTTDWGSAGYKTTAFTAPASLGAGVYYAAWLSVGTTPITVARSSAMNSNALNAGLTAATARYTTGGTGFTGLTALPSPATMSNRTLGATSIWLSIT